MYFLHGRAPFQSPHGSPWVFWASLRRISRSKALMRRFSLSRLAGSAAIGRRSGQHWDRDNTEHLRSHYFGPLIIQRRSAGCRVLNHKRSMISFGLSHGARAKEQKLAESLGSGLSAGAGWIVYPTSRRDQRALARIAASITCSATQGPLLPGRARRARVGPQHQNERLQETRGNCGHSERIA